MSAKSRKTHVRIEPFTVSPWYAMESGPPEPMSLDVPPRHPTREIGRPSPESNEWHLTPGEHIEISSSQEARVHASETLKRMAREPVRNWSDQNGAQISPVDHMRRMTTPVKKGPA